MCDKTQWINVRSKLIVSPFNVAHRTEKGNEKSKKT